MGHQQQRIQEQLYSAMAVLLLQEMAQAVLLYTYSILIAIGATANTFSNGELYIPNYAGSANKPTSWFNAQENNTTTAYINSHANLWSNTSAITSITLTASVGTNEIKSGSSFYLYGISKN